jgi:hypothetical protein
LVGIYVCYANGFNNYGIFLGTITAIINDFFSQKGYVILGVVNVYMCQLYCLTNSTRILTGHSFFFPNRETPRGYKIIATIWP